MAQKKSSKTTGTPLEKPNADTELTNETVPAPVDETAPLIIPPEPPLDDELISVDDTIDDEDATPAAAAARPVEVVEPAVATNPIRNSAKDILQRSSLAAGVRPVMFRPQESEKRTLKVAALVVVLLFLLIGTVFAYFDVYVPRVRQGVVEQALANTLYEGKLTSAAFSGTSTITDKTTKANYAVDYSGQTGKNGQLDLTLSIAALTTKVSVELRTLDGKNYYLRVNGLGDLPQLLKALAPNSSAGQTDATVLQTLAPALSSVNNQWYEINQSLVQSLEQSHGLSSDDLHLSKADATKIALLYEKHNFLVVDKQLADQQIGGVTSYHYQLHVDQKKFAAFLSGVQQAHISGLSISQSQVNSLANTDFSKYPFELWISRNTKVIDQLKLSSGSGSSTTLNQLTLTKLNQPVTLSAPAGAQSVLQLLTQLFQAQAGSGATGPGLTQLLGA